MSELIRRLGGGAARRVPVSTVCPSCSPEQSSAASSLMERVLPGMIARDFGIETLCLYLAIARAALLDVIATRGLVSPHDRPHRGTNCRNAWRAEDVSVLIVLWMDGWAAGSLAERFGRSRNAIWSKARHLGLPRRARTAQFRPFNPHAVVQSPSHDGSIASGAVGASLWNIPGTAPATPASPSRSSGAVLPFIPTVIDGHAATVTLQPAVTHQPPATGLPTIKSIPDVAIPGVTRAQLEACLELPSIVRKGGRGEIAHDAKRDLQLALRVFSSQHYLTAAREMGMSVSAFTSRRRRLGLPPMARGESVKEFNPEWAASMIEALGYKRVQCRGYKSRGLDFYFWCSKTQQMRFSNLAKGKAWYKENFEGICHLH